MEIFCSGEFRFWIVNSVIFPIPAFCCSLPVTLVEIKLCKQQIWSSILSRSSATHWMARTTHQLHRRVVLLFWGVESWGAAAQRRRGLALQQCCSAQWDRTLNTVLISKHGCVHEKPDLDHPFFPLQRRKNKNKNTHKGFKYWQVKGRNSKIKSDIFL